MTAESAGMHAATSSNLSQRWPDLAISRSFHELLAVYHILSKSYLEESGKPAIAAREGYETICRWIQESVAKSSESHKEVEDRQKPERMVVRSLVLNLKNGYGCDWLQSVASLLGMLMHFVVGKRGSNSLINHRRPQKPFSTYPTSPAVARIVGDAILTYLLKQTIPAVCHRSVDAERYAERAFSFRVLDPSMESGQLLLEVALASIRQVQRKHSPQSRTAQYLTRALVEKLSRDCLWGIDRNELATRAVLLLFSLLGAEFGMSQLAPLHLFTADALKCFNREPFSRFNGIINNPPWGEVLNPRERKQLRMQFSSLHYHSDTYVAFSELAIRSLEAGGIFGLILPSQAVGARNTARLRELFLSKADVDQVILLPRSAFANASVRGLVLLGRVQPTGGSTSCHVTTYPIVKRFDAIGPACSFAVPAHAFRDAGKNTWWPLINVDTSVRSHAPTIRLEEIATVTCGVQVYCRGRGIPPQTVIVVRRRPFTLVKAATGAVPAVRGRDVHEFCLSDPREFVKFGKWLARVGNHDSLRHSTRIFVREICRRDGKLTATVARDGVIPLHGVLTIIPRMIDVHVLVGVLNSAVVAEYVRKHAASFSKVDFQRITVSELRKMPIPVAAIGPFHRAALGISPPTGEEFSLSNRLITLARRLSHVASMNDSEVQKLRVQVDTIVLAMYGLREKDRNA